MLAALGAAVVWIAVRRAGTPLRELRLVGDRVQRGFAGDRVEELLLSVDHSESAVRIRARPPGMRMVSRREETYWLVYRAGRARHLLNREALKLLTEPAGALDRAAMKLPSPEQGSPKSEMRTFVPGPLRPSLPERTSGNGRGVRPLRTPPVLEPQV